MVVGQHRAVRLLICNVNRLHAGMSRANAPKCSEPVRPRAENAAISDKPAVRGRGGDFFAIRMRKNTTSCPIAWTGYVWPATLNQAMGGQSVCFCSDPIPPVAVATDQPAKHVLSRSAGGTELVRQPSLVHNRQLTVDFAPVVDLHRPLFRSFKRGQIQCLQ